MKREVFFLWLGVFISLGLFFQNCAQDSMTVDVASAPYTPTPVPIVSFSSKPSCLFNGQMLSEGQSVTAYLNSTPETGGCISQTRDCTNSILSGSYAFATCRSGAKSCLFNGRTVQSQESVTAYSALVGTSCVFETRSCQDGVLSGSFPYALCSSGTNSCLFNGRTLQANQAFIYYEAGSCQAQTGYCQSAGFLTDGQGTPLASTVQAACSTSGAKTCNFQGQTLNANQSFAYYAPASSCVLKNGVCDSSGQLIDSTTRAVLDQAFSDASTCQIARDSSGTTTTSSGSTTLPLYEGLPTCTWHGRTLPMGQQFQYYYYSTGYSWMCEAHAGMCAADGSLRSLPYFQGLNGDQIYESCQVIVKRFSVLPQ